MLEVDTVVVGVFVRTKVGVVVVINVVGIVGINGVFGFKHWRYACVRVGVIFMVAIPTALLVAVLSGIAEVVGGVSSTVCLANDLICVSGEPIGDAVGLLRMEVACVVLNIGVQAL